MLWRCPSCGAPLQPRKAEDQPGDGPYRCHVCRLDLLVETNTHTLVLAPTRNDEPSMTAGIQIRCATALGPLTVTSYHELVTAAATDPHQSRLIAHVLHQIANALQEAIGVCDELREEGSLTPEGTARLDVPIVRAVGALGQLQPRRETRQGDALNACRVDKKSGDST